MDILCFVLLLQKLAQTPQTRRHLRDHTGTMENESDPFLQESEMFESLAEHKCMQTARPRKTASSSCISTHLFTAFITSLIWGTLLQFALKHQQNTHSTLSTATTTLSPLEDLPPFTYLNRSSYLHCGDTPTAALALNCTYDILSNHWLPQPCSDPVSVREYQSFGPSWHGYTSATHASPPLSIAGMSEAKVYYTNMRDHILHCAMLWRRQYRAFFEGSGRALDSLIVDREHTMHCSDFLVRMTEFGVDMRSVPIEVEVGFAGCWIRDEGERVCE